MDVFEALDTLRSPLVSAEKKNGTATNTWRSRYKSPTPPPPSTTSKPRRCPSPNFTRNVSVSSATKLGSSKRAASAERKRPATPPSPPPLRPSTPVSETSVEQPSSLSKKITGSSRLPEMLWPSTMRSLNVSFQSDIISIPVASNKREKLSDRTLKPSSNVAHRQAEKGSVPRKPTPERKPSPLKGKNTTHQSENSRPVDGAQARLIDQHRWPSRAGGKLSANLLTKSVDLSNNNNRDNHHHHLSVGKSPLRRLSVDGVPRNLMKVSSDASQQQSGFEEHVGVLGLRMKSIDDSLLRVSALQKVHSLSLSEKEKLDGGVSAARSRLVSRSRLQSPSRAASVSKFTPSPSKTRPSTPTQSRGTSPSRVRPSTPTRQASGTASVLSFVADIKKGRKTNQLEDAHLLRLLYNRQLQWRFANARADAALFIQRITTEQTLYNVWETNLELWDSVLRKRIELQRLNMDIKLDLVLREQMAHLEEWALLEEVHCSSLDGAIEDLEASTLRLPITGGAKADIESLKAAISSAADVMQTMGSSICSMLSKAEGMNGLVSELAELAGHERAMLNECDTLLSSSAAMQVKEYSLRTQLIQSHQNLTNSRLPLFWAIS
ncbi:hypothetical protein RND81_08G037500 [Saponaria officinalis]|uniref:AUGMIN subunit 8 n=1 Tax=Saponaria officinalis TaxID=3572 RepID=A0AAW1J354_SAPOF